MVVSSLKIETFKKTARYKNMHKIGLLIHKVTLSRV